MSKFKKGDRVIIGEPGDEEIGVVLDNEGPQYPKAYMVQVDEKIEEHDDRLREVMENQMKPAGPISFPLFPIPTFRGWVILTIRRGTHSDMYGATREGFISLHLTHLRGGLLKALKYARNVRHEVNLYREDA